MTNPLPIYYRRAGICYPTDENNPNPSTIHLFSITSRTKSITPVNRQSIGNVTESIDASAKPSDNRPIFQPIRPIRPLQPLAFSL
jgi:hypothetical protein